MADTRARLAAALAGRYRIERELGAGGMATVWLAHDLKHDRKVAIKVLHPHLAAMVGADRFLKEIKTTANLQHPHILALHDSGDADGLLFYVMPFVDGESLRQRITRDKQLPIADGVRLAAEVAGALDYAHRQGVIHRDIKPENILLHEGSALVADFGIAIATDAKDTRLTETGLSIGTPAYMSPEQALGERNLDARTDIYATGAVLYEMLTGSPPFTGASAQAIVAKAIAEQPVPPSRHRREIPAQLNDAVLTALEKNPDHRFATAAALESAVAGLAPARISRRSRRRIIRGAGLALGLGAVTFGAARVLRHGPPVALAHVPDSSAVELVKTANYLVKDRTASNCTQAIRMLSRATAADSLYAAAWASLAKANALCALFGDGDPDVMFAAALAPAKHALELDPRASDSHTTLGMVHLFHEQAFNDARQEFIAASALDSTKYEPWLFRSWTYLAANQVDSAVYYVRQAKRLRPVGDEIVGVRLATMLRKQGRYAEAQAELDQVLQVNPASGLARGEQFEFHLEQHHCREAAAVAPLTSRYVLQYEAALRAVFWVYCDKPERARRYAQTLAADTSGGRYVDEFSLGGVYAVLSDTAKMFQALHAALTQHNWALFFLHNHFFFRQYTDLPEFRAIMAAAHVK
jgi:tetratricopeptide (TPR) repeat protein